MYLAVTQLPYRLPRRMTVLLPLLLLLMLVQSVDAFYIPGFAPKTYRKGDLVPLVVDSLAPMQSSETEPIHGVINVDYYDPRLRLCEPKKIVNMHESLGSILMGDRFKNSVFDLRLLVDEQCKKLCVSGYSGTDFGFFKDVVDMSLGVRWFIDGLPVMNSASKDDTSSSFMIGHLHGSQMGTLAINNYYDLTIEYYQQNDDSYRIVGAYVEPSSRKIAVVDPLKCEASDLQMISYNKPSKVIFAYSIKWKRSETKWATRWDKYLSTDSAQIHWLSLVNAAAIVFLLATLIGLLLFRTVNRDIDKFNSVDLDELPDEYGWKLLHGDVFRPPRHRMLLSTLLGNGSHLLLMSSTVLALSLMGLLSPSNRGSIMTATAFFYFIYSSIGGYVSARCYRMMGGESWTKCMLLTPLCLSSLLMGTMLLLNFVLVLSNGSGALPFGTLLLLLLLWLGVAVPSSFAGSFVGNRAPVYVPPSRTNQIPRQVPKLRTVFKPWVLALLSGSLPFIAIFYESLFIARSIWYGKIYYMFGFLFVCGAMMIAACAAITTLTTYGALNNEDYRWWWRSFVTGGSCAIYIFLNSIAFWITQMSVPGFAAHAIYFGYSLLLSLLTFIATGTVGFFSSFFMIHKMYSSIKIN